MAPDTSGWEAHWPLTEILCQDNFGSLPGMSYPHLRKELWLLMCVAVNQTRTLWPLASIASIEVPATTKDFVSSVLLSFHHSHNLGLQAGAVPHY